MRKEDICERLRTRAGARAFDRQMKSNSKHFNPALSETSHFVESMAADLIESQRSELSRLRGRVRELEACLQEIITEKELHGQVVDGTVKARGLLSTGSAE